MQRQERGKRWLPAVTVGKNHCQLAPALVAPIVVRSPPGLDLTCRLWRRLRREVVCDTRS